MITYYDIISLQTFSCTDVFTSVPEIGIADEYGNYTGQIGILQRNVSTHMYRTCTIDDGRS